jgi:hypothetical protein
MPMIKLKAFPLGSWRLSIEEARRGIKAKVRLLISLAEDCGRILIWRDLELGDLAWGEKERIQTGPVELTV